MDSANNANFSIDALLGPQQHDGPVRKMTQCVPSLPSSTAIKNTTLGEKKVFRKKKHLNVNSK
jgi:hypothetical protein